MEALSAQPAPAACSLASHDALKADAARWSALAHIGDQHVPADEDGPAERIELRNCHCGSTLAVQL